MNLTDAYGRTIEYLRISLTDKCNLRCRYCMPAGGIGRLQHSEVLSLEEICRVASVLTELGIRRIRLTGGEPLVRRGIQGLMRNLAELPARPELAMTTNGVLLADHLEELKASGLRSINISLDTRDRERYRELTGTDGLEAVEQAIDRAYAMGFPVKLNAVPIRGINEEELTDLAEYARDRRIDVRFIELMPMGCAKAYQGIPEAEILQKLEDRFGPAEQETADAFVAKQSSLDGTPEEIAEHPRTPGRDPAKGRLSDSGSAESRLSDADTSEPRLSDRGPAKYVRFRGFAGRVGFISPMSHAFCSECNRLRLTVDGRLKLCLYYPEGLDVRELLRSGCTDEELKKAIRGIIRLKPERHSFCETRGAKDRRSMYEIGG